MNISVCIVTYNRPEKLKEAIESCLSQSLKPKEILIGDDSPNDLTKQMVEDLFLDQNEIEIQYFHNIPSLGEYKNVHDLFMKANGDYITLLHDDDLFENNALQILANCFQISDQIMIAYGKQYIIYEDGKIDYELSEQTMKKYYKTQKYAGIQKNVLEKSIVQHIPNDTYMVKASIIKEIGYLKAGEADDACDFYFGVLLAQKLQKMNGYFYFVNEYTAKYRISTESISRRKDNNANYNSFKIVLNLDDKIKENFLVNKWLTDVSASAISQAVKLNHRLEGFAWYFGKYYRKKIFSLGGIKRLLLLLRPYK